MPKQTLAKAKEQSIADKERLLILSQTETIKGEQLSILPDGIKVENEFKKFALGDIDDPQKKYDLYYKGIMKLLMRYLPKGKANKKYRALIYEEKNTFLTRGKRKNKAGFRKGDSRMAYISDIEDTLNIISTWIVGGGNMGVLYKTLLDTNEARGYGKPIN